MTAAEVEREVTTTISLGVRPVVDGQVNLDTLIQSLDVDNQKVVAQVLAASEPTALLLVLKGAGRGNRFMVDKAGTTIGRAADSGIFLDDVTVSRKHATINFDQEFSFTDSGSLNGSYLNNERATTAVLKSGDEIQIGKFHLVFISNKSSSTNSHSDNK
uniref:FHA domain-containing protein n=1 Tax=Candidatus Planktophila sp. TaxID=2175601 RepID=UPI00404B9A98